MVRLGDIGRILTGNTPKTSDEKNYISQDINFVKPSDFDEDKITDISTSDYFISELARNEARILPVGSVLVTCIGIIGKVGINSIECTFNQQINAIIPDTKKCNNKFLAYEIQFKKDELQELANAPVVPILNKTQFSNIQIKLPTIEEQNKIVANLDKVNEIIDKRKQQLKKLDELVKSRFIEMFGNKKHLQVKIKNVCDFITKGTTPNSSDIYTEYAEGMIPYIKVYNLSFTGDLIFDEKQQFIKEDIHKNLLKRSKVYPKDVLMNIVGPPLGKFALVTNQYKEWNVNQAIAIFRSKSGILPEFLLYSLMQPAVLKPFLDQAVGIRQLNISLEQCRNIEIPLPDIDKQKEFVCFVEQITKSKLKIQKSLDKLEILKKSLMQEYFG